MSDTIDRQAAIEAIGKTSDELYENIKKGATFPQRQWFDGMAQAQSILENLPSAQPEEAIPVAWLEEQAKWFESMDNAFAKIEASNIRMMIKKWRGEKDERSD